MAPPFSSSLCFVVPLFSITMTLFLIMHTRLRYIKNNTFVSATSHKPWFQTFPSVCFRHHNARHTCRYNMTSYLNIPPHRDSRIRLEITRSHKKCLSAGCFTLYVPVNILTTLHLNYKICCILPWYEENCNITMRKYKHSNVCTQIKLNTATQRKE